MSSASGAGPGGGAGAGAGGAGTDTLMLVIEFAESSARDPLEARTWFKHVHDANVNAENGLLEPGAREEAEIVAHAVLAVGGFQRRIAVDLSKLRESWVRHGFGETRIPVFDRAVQSCAVSIANPTEETGVCEFSGLPSVRLITYEFGDEFVDAAPRLVKKIDRTVFADVVRPIVAYAHFLERVAQWPDMYGLGLTLEQKADFYQHELDELRNAIIALTTRCT